MTAYRCPQDGIRADTTTLTWCCPVCRGPWDLDFEVTEPLSLNSLAGRVNSLWRYEEVLPLAAPATTLGEGRTPLVPLTGTVSAKLDFLMPTLSFKDRGAVMLAELARRLNPERVVADSSGNAGTAVAAYCARAGLPCTVYVPEGTSPKKTEQIRAHGARLEIVPGDREATALAARAAADAPGTFYASHVFNPYFLHGTKTYVYEMWEDLGGSLPDAIAVPVGNGTLLLGAALATAELHAQGLIERRPALIAVQAEAVSPLAAAFRSGADDLPGDAADGPAAPTLAEGIAIPRPPRARQILAAVRESGGTFLTVPEDRIRSAQLDLAARGFYVETTGVACWAAVGDWTDRSVVVPLCGAGLKSGLAAPA
ncbi:threonine synthase [Streptomyces sp. NPDC058620]|uniref:threonine synthase n=1 Tax=Streptomyces sp. NPDC058620 TaxID=3346560 RepID=UPI003654AAC1